MGLLKEFKKGANKLGQAAARLDGHHIREQARDRVSAADAEINRLTLAHKQVTEQWNKLAESKDELVVEGYDLFLDEYNLQSGNLLAELEGLQKQRAELFHTSNAISDASAEGEEVYGPIVAQHQGELAQFNLAVLTANSALAKMTSALESATPLVDAAIAFEEAVQAELARRQQQEEVAKEVERRLAVARLDGVEAKAEPVPMVAAMNAQKKAEPELLDEIVKPVVEEKAKANAVPNL